MFFVTYYETVYAIYTLNAFYYQATLPLVLENVPVSEF